LFRVHCAVLKVRVRPTLDHRARHMKRRRSTRAGPNEVGLESRSLRTQQRA